MKFSRVSAKIKLYFCFCLNGEGKRVRLGTELRSEKIPRNRLGTVSVIPRKKVLIPRYSEFRGRANSEARNVTNGAEFREKMKFYGTD